MSASARPLFLELPALIDWSRRFADEARAGRYPYARFDPVRRCHQRIYRDPRVDVWLIGWLPTQGTQLHDHGGSSGSFTVLSGSLVETVVSGRAGGGLRHSRDLTRTVGECVGSGRTTFMTCEIPRTRPP